MSDYENGRGKRMEMLDLLEKAKAAVEKMRSKMMQMEADNRMKSDLIILLSAQLKRDKKQLLELGKKCKYCMHVSYAPDTKQHFCNLYGSKYWKVDGDFWCKDQAIMIPGPINELLFGEEMKWK
jgi:hypothetical protein